jgi:flagellar assembly protein FliH
MKQAGSVLELRETGDFDRLVDQAYRELENSRRIAQGIITNARDEAEAMVTRARAQASDLVARARDQAGETLAGESDRLRAEARQAYDEGFAEGLTKGTAEGQRQFDAVMAKVGGILDYLSRERERVLAGCRAEMVDLVLKIADRVIRIEKETIRKLLGENLKQLLDESASGDETVLLLNPADIPEVTQHLAERGGPLPKHRIHADAGVPVGEARVRGRAINVDLSFEKRFQVIRDRLAQRFGNSGACSAEDRR